MPIACELPVDAGRAGRRLQALARAVPGLGLLSSAVLLAAGPPVWAEALLTDTARIATQAILASVGLACLTGALRALTQRSVGLPSTREVHRDPPRLMLDEHGLARLDDESLRLDSVCSLPGLIVAVFTPISEAGPKLSVRGGYRFVQRLTGDRRVVMIGQDALSPDQWRRLHVWLLWVQRAPR